MAEGWVECPALGPGWKRREAFRKSGVTCGRTDTYYQSPTGEKFRSKIELSRFLGPGRDLRNFDFKNGRELQGPPRSRKGPKWRPPEPPPALPEPLGGAAAEQAPPPERQATPPPVQVTPPERQATPPPPAQATPPPELEPNPAEATPLPAQATPPPAEATPLPARRTRKRPPPPEPPQEGTVASCAGCQRLCPGVSVPPQRRCRWLCPECRAQRRDFNREQRFYKRVGCGSCQACRLPADCGICSACARPRPGPAPSGPGPAPPGPPGPAPCGPGPAPPPKCLLRRCLRIVKKGPACGACGGCRSTEDCGSCCICLRRLRPGLKRQWRCLRRRCQHPKRSGAAKKAPAAATGRKGTAKWKPPLEREPSVPPSTRHRKQLNKMKEKKKPGRPPKHPGARGGGARGGRSRRSRRCGACAACLRPGDCGRCDFCRDKPKFGGQNLKRQKCRWRQCLRCAADEEQPMGGAEKGPAPPPSPPLRLVPFKEEAGPLPHPQDPRLGLLIASVPRLKVTLPPPSGTPRAPPPGDLGVLIAATPRVKQEPPPPSASLVPVPPRPPPAKLVVLDESEEEEEEEGGSRVPLPLPRPPSPHWPGTFLAELAEIPLPAHWGVVGQDPPHPPATSATASPASPHSPPPPPPGLRLVQRSPRSPMAAAVVLLGPGLAFRVLAAPGRPVPPGHEVLSRRPPRLRSVDDLVELLCDLEAWRPCPGPPGVPPAPRCQVLVPGGRCCRPCLLLGGGGH